MKQAQLPSPIPSIGVRKSWQADTGEAAAFGDLLGLEALSLDAPTRLLLQAQGLAPPEVDDIIGRLCLCIADASCHELLRDPRTHTDPDITEVDEETGRSRVVGDIPETTYRRLLVRHRLPLEIIDDTEAYNRGLARVQRFAADLRSLSIRRPGVTQAIQDALAAA